MFAEQSILVALFVLVAIGSCSVKADIADYGEFSLDKEGYVKLCLTRSLVKTEFDHYVMTSAIDKKLAADQEELEKLIEGSYSQFGGIEGCPNRCDSKQSLDRSVDLEEKELRNERCFFSGKHQRLCKLIKERKFTDQLKLDIETWVCGMDNELRVDLFVDGFTCSQHDKSKGAYTGEDQFHKYINFTKSELENGIALLNNKLNDSRKRVEELQNGTFARIAKSIDIRLPEYKVCWRKEEEAAEEMISREKEMEKEKEKAEVKKIGRGRKLLNKMFN